jgi:hypothetical protein
VADNVGVIGGVLQGDFDIATKDLGGDIHAQKIAVVEFETPGGDTLIVDTETVKGLNVVLAHKLAAGNGTEILDSVSVTGLVAHGVALNSQAEQRPVQLGARSRLSALPTALGSDELHVGLIADEYGRLIVTHDYADTQDPVSIAATTSGDTQVLAAPGSGLSLYIRKGSLVNGGSAALLCGLQANGSATSRWSGTIGKEGGGALFDFGQRGWKLPANTALDVNLAGAGDVKVNISDYYIAA